ncbi:MAG: cobalamin biosynthesis protein, partial [Chloroflexota bacterium]|nr:cobalamin biosynthesis protein [Chloroflexota bacterium]
MILWTAALALDLVAGEPPAWAHPVVWLGRAIARLAAAAPDDPRAEARHGVLVVAVPAAAAALAGLAVRRVPSRAARIVLSVWLLKASFSLRALIERTGAVGEALAARDIDGARDELRHLVSRPRGELDAAHAASAAVESVAENLTDSYVAPLLWYAAGGLPLALAYRAVNTADAMVGYRGAYERLGKASARADDLLGYVPARCAAAALIAAAPAVGLDGCAALRV